MEGEGEGPDTCPDDAKTFDLRPSSCLVLEQKRLFQFKAKQNKSKQNLGDYGAGARVDSTAEPESTSTSSSPPLLDLRAL